MEQDEIALFRERLRGAFSYREKALSESTAHPGEAALGRHATQAARTVECLRTEAARIASRAESRLRGLNARIAQLHQKASSSRMAPERINERHRTLSRMAASATYVQVGMREAFNARASADLGGFIDLPLEAYARKLRTPRVDPPPAYWFAVIASCAIALIAISLPWLHAAGESGSLIHIGRPLAAAGAITDPVPDTLNALWVAALLMPLAALGLALMRLPWLATAWGLLLAGCGMAAAGATPLALLLLRSGAAPGLSQWMHATGVGLWAYGLAGLAIIMCASWRRDLILGRAESTWREVFVVGGTILGVFFLAAWAASLLPGGGMAFRAALSGRDDGRIEITCANRTRMPALVRLTPPSFSTSTDGPAATQTYYVSIYVKGRTEPVFRLLPEPGPVWTLPGNTLQGEEEFSVGPGLAASFSANAFALLDNRGAFDALKLVFSDAHGRHVYESQFDAAPASATITEQAGAG